LRVEASHTCRPGNALAGEHHEPTIIVSLLDVRYIGSSGLTVLIHEHKMWRDCGERLLIVLPRPPVSRVFEITQLTEILLCFQELPDAIQDARSGYAGTSIDRMGNGKAS
jgi:anti-anti-sigma factor